MRLPVVLCLLCVSVATSAQESAKEILEKMITAMKSHKSVSYEAEFRIKLADLKDTTTTKATVHLLRDDRDTLWGGMVWIGRNTQNNSYAFYNLDRRYIVMDNSKKVWREKPENNMGLGGFYGSFFSFSFLKPSLLHEEYVNAKSQRLDDTTIQGKDCYAIAVEKEHENWHTYYHVLYLSKKDYFPLLTTSRVGWDNKLQYSEMHYTSHTFDKVKSEQFSPTQFPASYEVAERRPNAEASYSVAAKEIADQVKEKYKKHSSLSYTARLETIDETGRQSKTDGQVHLLRDKNDYILGGLVWMSEGLKYDTYSFYDGAMRYVVTKVIHKAWTEKMTNPELGLSVMQNNMLLVPFFDRKATISDYQTARVNKQDDTTINGMACYKLVYDVTFLDKEKNENDPLHTGTEIHYINQSQDMPVLIVRQENNHGKSSYFRLELSNYQFDKVGPEQFSAKQIPSDYTIESRDRELPKGAQPQVRPRNEWPVPGRNGKN